MKKLYTSDALYTILQIMVPELAPEIDWAYYYIAAECTEGWDIADDSSRAAKQ